MDGAAGRRRLNRLEADRRDLSASNEKKQKNRASPRFLRREGGAPPEKFAVKGGGAKATQHHGGRRRFRAELHPEAATKAGGRWEPADLRVSTDQRA